MVYTSVATLSPSSSIQYIPNLSIKEDFPTPGLPLIPILIVFLPESFLLELSNCLTKSWASLECSGNLDSTRN